MAVSQSTVNEPEDIVQDIVTASLRNKVKRLRIELRVLAAVNLQEISCNHVICDRCKTSPKTLLLLPRVSYSTGGQGRGVLSDSPRENTRN